MKFVGRIFCLVGKAKGGREKLPTVSFGTLESELSEKTEWAIYV